MCQPLPTLQGGQRADPGSMAFSNTSLGAPWIIPRWRAPGPLLREPELCARAQCTSNWSIAFYTSPRGRRTWCYSPAQPLLCSSESPEQPKPRLAREPDPQLLPTGDCSAPRGALAKILHLSQHSKVWSHSHVPLSCLYQKAAGRNHFPQNIQGKQELSVKIFIFDEVFSFQTGVRGQQGGNGLSKNSHSAFFKCFVGPGYKEIRKWIKSTDNMLQNILESFQSLAKVFWFPLLLIIYHKM